MKRPVELKCQPPKISTAHSRHVQVGPSFSNNAQGSSSSAPALGAFPTCVDNLVDVNPGVTAFTLIPSPFNSCANAMVYELRAALLELYAVKAPLLAADPAGNFLSGFAWIVLDPNVLLTFRMTPPIVDLRMRDSMITVVCMTPKRLTSIVSRKVETAIVAGFWSATILTPVTTYTFRTPSKLGV
jgi:hypothetical protein